MKVRYLPSAGFGQAPAFVEYEGDAPLEQSPLYQRQDFLRLNLDCHNVEVHERWEAAPGGNDEPDVLALPKRSIWATGVIGQARWGRFSLSFLGHSKTYEELAVSIHRSRGTVRTYLAGQKGVDDLDVSWNAGFFLEVHIDAEQYDALETALVRPGARLRLSVEAGLFRRFYATWSPSISEGRVIKFLDTVNDVENAAEMPKDMVDRSGEPEEDARLRPSVEIDVVWPVGEQKAPPVSPDERANDEDAAHKTEREEYARRVEEAHRSVQASVAQSMRKEALALLWHSDRNGLTGQPFLSRFGTREAQYGPRST